MRADRYLRQWVEEGVVDAATAARIADFEATRRRPAGMGTMLIGLAGLAIGLGVAALIGANWDQLPSLLKLGVHALVNGAVALALFRFVQTQRDKTIWFDLLVGLLAALTLTFIALVGQIYQTQEPVWKALVLWLGLTTPFWLGLGERRMLIRAWILSLLVTHGFLVADAIPAEAALTRALLVTLAPFALIGVGQASVWQGRRAVTLEEISRAGFLLMALLVSLPLTSWSFDTQELASHLDHALVWHTLGVSAATAVGLVVMRRVGLLRPMALAVDVFVLVSVVAGAVPFLVDPSSPPGVGAVILIGYWALCGWAGAAAGHPWAVRLATLLIALRLIAIYVQVFGSLLMTGTGLIASGILLLLLVWGTRRALTGLARARRETKS